MSVIVPITGNVKYQIVLDPSSWIFDDRKIEWNDYTSQTILIEDVINKHGQRAGAAMPRLIERGVKYEKERWLTDSFVIPVSPFLNNAEPMKEATLVRFETDLGESATFPIETFKAGVFVFSKNGKALKEDGPLHFCDLDQYKNNPIKGIKEIKIL